MDLQTDAVAQPMSEVLAVARGFDNGMRRGVDTLGRNAGADDRRRLGLRLPDQLVDAPELGLGLDARLTGDPDGSGGVAQVAGQRATQVEDYRLAGRDSSAAGVVMG